MRGQGVKTFYYYRVITVLSRLILIKNPQSKTKTKPSERTLSQTNLENYNTTW